MLCCRDGEKILGMVRVGKQEVVDACKNTLNRIHKSRSNYRRQQVQEYLENADWWWRHLWRLVGFKKPTRRDALNYYYHGSTIPESFGAVMMHGEQEEKCNKILGAANATPKASMWISPEGISAIGL